MRLRLHEDKRSKTVLGQTSCKDLTEGSKRKWVQRPESAVYIFSGDLKVAMHVPILPCLPPSLLRSVGQRHSVRLRADFSHSWECWVVWRPVYTGAWTS